MSANRSKLANVALAGALALGAVVSTVSLTAPAQAVGTSSVNGPISRSEIIARAQNWVDQAVPYSQSLWHSDSNGSYRQDCSGLVSMAWHLGSSRVTSTLDDISTQLGSLDDLQPGDMIDNISTHVVLFAGWTDGSHNTAVVYEEPRPGLTARKINYSRSSLISGGFKPFRYDKTVDSTPLPPKQGAVGWGAQVVVNGGGNVFHTTRSSNGSWTGFGNVESVAGDIGGVQSIADAGINGDTHLLAVGGDGNIYHTIRHSGGSWDRFTDIGPQTNRLGNVTKVSAVSIGGDLHVVAVADGKLFHTARLANGTWQPFAELAPVIGSFTANRVSAANIDGEFQAVFITNDDRIMHTIRDGSGSWDPAAPIQLNGVSGNHYAVSIGGTYN